MRPPLDYHAFTPPVNVLWRYHVQVYRPIFEHSLPLSVDVFAESADSAFELSLPYLRLPSHLAYRVRITRQNSATYNLSRRGEILDIILSN